MSFTRRLYLLTACLAVFVVPFACEHAAAMSTIDREDADDSEDLSIDTDAQNRVGESAGHSDNAQFSLDHIYVAPSPKPDPIEVPCEALIRVSHIPFAQNKKEIVNLLRDVSLGGDKSTRQFVCPAETMSELRRLIDGLGGHVALAADSNAIRSMALSTNGFARLGQECAVDVLMLSDSLHHWASEIESLSAAIEHTTSSCTQAWAHFLSFLDRSISLSAPSFRSEKCIFVDEYRSCFEPKNESNSA